MSTLREAQGARAVVMVRPAAFAANPETAATNAFQGDGGGADVRDAAVREFDVLANRLERSGVVVHVLDDLPVPARPDAVFPNNWFSVHADGRGVLYPMLAPNRRLERRAARIAALAVAEGYRLAGWTDLTPFEQQGEFLEGTGSLVLDRPNRVAYASLSPRTTPGALAAFASRLGYRIVSFVAEGSDARPVYHTNVVLSIGPRFAVACLDAIADPESRRRVAAELQAGGREVIAITQPQRDSFAANLLALEGSQGPVIAMSHSAWTSFNERQRERLARHGEPVISAVPTIERYGGGSVRCMLAEMFLPRGVPPR